MSPKRARSPKWAVPEQDAKVLLINYAGFVMTANTFLQDNSLALLGGFLKRDGIEVEILDFQGPLEIGEILEGMNPSIGTGLHEKLKSGKGISEQEFSIYEKARRNSQKNFEENKIKFLLNKIDHEKPGLIGFKLWAGNGLKGAVRMATVIKEVFPEVTLVAGGPAVRYGGTTLFKEAEAFDYLIYGEGEEALLKLVRGVRQGIPNAIWRNEGMVLQGKQVFFRDLDQIPFAAYDACSYPGGGNFFKMRVLDDSRGCFNRCAFCAHPSFSGVTRKRSPKHLVDEMERDFVENGVRYFRMAGSNPPILFLESVAREILARDLPVLYSAYSSMNQSKGVDFALLHRSGLRGLFFGIESADEALLRKAHRKNNLGKETVLKVVEEAMRSGIFVCLSFIVPSPFETEDTKKTSLDLIQRLFSKHQNGSVLVLPAFLTPGSLWWENATDFGFSFQEGFDKNHYIRKLLEFDPHFLLPRHLLQDTGFLLHGKSFAELSTECHDFVRTVETLGIPTNIDDASFLMAHMSHRPIPQFKEEMIRNLLCGSQKSLVQFILEVNRSTKTASV